MSKFLMCSMLIISSACSNASNIGWLDFSNIPETRKHFKEETSTILNACKNKESYRRMKNFGAIEYIGFSRISGLNWQSEIKLHVNHVVVETHRINFQL